MYSVDYAPVLLVYVMLFAMFAYEYVNVNVPLIHHMSCVHCVSYPMNCTMEIHSIKRISELMELHNKWIVELVLMVMLSVYIYDILDYWWIMRRKKFKIFCLFPWTLTNLKLENVMNYTYFRYFSSADFSRNGIPEIQRELYRSM